MWPWGREIQRVREEVDRVDDALMKFVNHLASQVVRLEADLREVRGTLNALLIAKGQAAAGGAGLAGMLREAADEAAAVEDEEAEAAREEADAFADFLKKYEKDDLDG